MPRRINPKLINRFLNGDLKSLLNYIKMNPCYKMECRIGGKTFIYYKKLKALELGFQSSKIDKKYFTISKSYPQNISNNLIYNPSLYFDYVKDAIDAWLILHPKKEFELQQNIAYFNQSFNDKYIIIDMEYNFSQAGLPKNQQSKRAGFDLLGIERKTGNVVFFEVKKGLNSLTKASGIASHIIDFEKFLFGNVSFQFISNLKNDIQYIISDKIQLGLIEKEISSLKLNFSNLELIFLYKSDDKVNIPNDLKQYQNIFDIEYKKSNSNRKYHTIFIDDTYKIL